MTRMGMHSMTDALKHMAGLSVRDYGGAGGMKTVSVRGIGARENSPAVGMYVDGIPLLNKGLFNSHLYGVERVDVLRGPQGTLYGMNTEG